MFFFCCKVLLFCRRVLSSLFVLRPLAHFAPTRENLHTFVPVEVQAAMGGPEHPRHIIMDKKQVELINIIWTVVKIAVGYLIGYLTNNPEAAQQVSDFLNY